MTSFESRVGLADNGEFRIKVRVAMAKVATEVVGETPKSPANIVKDDKRHDLGAAVLTPGGIENYLSTFAQACAYLGTLTTTSTDADVEFTVSSLWDDISGVSGAEA